MVSHHTTTSSSNSTMVRSIARESRCGPTSEVEDTVVGIGEDTEVDTAVAGIVVEEIVVVTDEMVVKLVVGPAPQSRRWSPSALSRGT